MSTNIYEKWSGAAIAKFIISIVALLFSLVPIIGVIMGLVAVGILISAVNNIRKHKVKGKSRTLTIAAIIISGAAIASTTLGHMGYYYLAKNIYQVGLDEQQKLIDEELNIYEDPTDDPVDPVDPDDPFGLNDDPFADIDKEDDPVVISVKAGPPTCPSGANGFIPGDSNAPPGRSPTQYSPPKLIGPWGNEATFSCSYKRDTGEREYEGDIIFENAILQADYQTTGSYGARPAWAQESYCTGSTDARGAYTDAYSSSHVIKVAYSARSGWDNANIAADMRPMALELIAQIEDAPYAIKC